jgi:hypothetical protein
MINEKGETLFENSATWTGCASSILHALRMVLQDVKN